MKILHLGVGSTAPTFILRRLKILSKKSIKCVVTSTQAQLSEYDVVIEYPIGSKMDLLKSIKYFIISPNLILRFIRMYSMQKNQPFKLRILRAIRYANLEGYKANLIHVHWINHLPELYWIKQYLNIPVIASVRGSMATIYPYKHASYEKKLQEAFLLSDRLHFVSRGLMNFCITRFQLNPRKCFVNYNGINTDKFAPLKAKKYVLEKVILVSVGAMIWRKNFQDLLKIIKQSIHRKKIDLRIIGGGEERFIIEFMINKYQLQNHVKLLGQLSEEQIIEQLQESDIYLSSSYAEGLSNAVMEAAACGLPVIAFECEGMNEIVIHNKSGLIIEHGRTDLFARALDDLIDDSQLRLEMGSAARQHVVAHFQEDRQVESMILEYQNTIDTYIRNGI